MLVQRHGLHRIAPAATIASLTSANSVGFTASTTLRLSPWRYRLLWVAVVLVSFLNGLLGTVFAAVYYGGLTIRDGYMIESVGLLPLRYIPLVLAAYVLVALYFFRVTYEVLAASVRARQLLLQRPRRPVRSSWWLLRPWRSLSQRWDALFAPGGFLELPPESFEFLFLVRECIEVATQTYQAYKCSTLIAQPWINTFYVTMLTTNCWVAPLIHVYGRRDATLRRFLFVCSDVVLDLCSTLVIPVCIIYSVILSAFDDNLNKASGGEYAFDVPYDDVYLMYMVKSGQQICVVTWLDFATKMMPFYSMASCIGHIQRLIEPPFAPVATRSHAHALLAMGGKSKSFRQRLLVGLQSSSSKLTARASQRSRARLRQFCQHRIVRFVFSVQCVHTLFVVWGIVVVACHVHATHVSRTAPAQATVGCKSHSQPWLVQAYSCTILEINCYRRGIQGLAHEIDAALAPLNALGLASLIISHCPALHIPPRIRTLRNLIGLEITNATLMSWPAEAAVREATNPSLQYFCLVRTNLTAVPAGLQALDFPTRLRDISIVESNLTELPSDLHRMWKNLLNLYIERTQLRSFPETVARMDVGRLSLLGNAIAQLPDDAFRGTDGRENRFQVLSIARNPIAHWPVSIGHLDDLLLVVMDFTLIAELPLWLLEEGERRAASGRAHTTITVSAGGSPLCAARQQELSSSVPPYRGLRVVCREKQDFEFEAYPLTFNRQIRPV